MKTTEQHFKDVVKKIVEAGGYPSPTAILAALGASESRISKRNLNGRQVQWRAEVLRSLGWTHRDDFRAPEATETLGRGQAGARRRVRRFQWQRPAVNSSPISTGARASL